MAGCIFVAVIGLGAWWYADYRPRAKNLRWQRQLLSFIESSDPRQRILGATRYVERPHPAVEIRIITGLRGDEPDESVRAEYAYALGRRKSDAGAAALQQAAQLDSSGLVRAAAWLGLARTAPERFDELAQEADPPADAWDELGLAQGRLARQDVSTVPTLLRFAREGEPLQRKVASLALLKALRPMLDAVGRWPLEADFREGQTIPENMVRELERRSAALPLPAIATDVYKHYMASQIIRHTIRRLTVGSDRITRILLPIAAEQSAAATEN